jgi:protoporphyrin/coproporphyrin ferrochelatase
MSTRCRVTWKIRSPAMGSLQSGSAPPMARVESPVGVVVLQLGTPESTDVRDVRRYLREFLSDPRVIDIPAPLRALLLNAVILPFRPRRSAEQYEKIWTDEGSPLLLNTELLARGLQEHLGDAYVVEVGMRYQSPSIASALTRLAGSGCDRIVIAPMFPQYASAAYGSAVAKTLELVASDWNVPATSTIPPFYDDPGFVSAVAEVAGPLLDQFEPDHILFSYHGLPESQIRKSDPSGEWCLQSDGCCDSIEAVNRFCYRAQSCATTKSLTTDMGLDAGVTSTSFQSRLAGQKWIEPYTDAVLEDLYRGGVRRLAVLTPSFVADCLETLEEIGIRLRNQWSAIGGEDLLLVPCVNASPGWVSALAEMVRGRARYLSDGDEEAIGGERADADTLAAN